MATRKIKPSKDILRHMEAKLDRMNTEMEFARSTSKYNKKEWKPIARKMQGKLDTIEDKLDTFSGRSDREISCLLQQRLDLRMFINIPGDFAANLELIEANYDAHVEKLNEYRKRFK